MSRKAYMRALVVRAIEDSIVLVGIFVGMWAVGAGVSRVFEWLVTIFA